MSFGSGGGFNFTGPQQQNPTPATVTGADNGVSMSTVTPTNTVLGQDVADPSSPAVLLSDREIPMNGFQIEFISPGLGNDRVQIRQGLIHVTNATQRLAMQAASLIWLDLVGGGSIDHLFSLSGTDLHMLVQAGGTNSGFLLDATNGRLCIGNNVVTPTAILHLLAGVNTASGAPFKYTAGVAAQTVLENGAKNFNGTNEFLTAGGVNYTMAKTLTNTAALDFPNTAAQTSSDLTITVTGAAVGDVVLLGVPAASVNADSCYTAFVSAANTVTVRFNNYSAGAIDPASGTFRAAIVKY